MGLPAELGELLGPYRIEELLGRGGMGCVYRATHLRLGREVAIKVLATELAELPEFASRFLHEAKIVNAVRHPNIIDIADFIDQQTPRRLAYVMELLPGASLSRLLQRGPLAVSSAVSIAEQIASALAAVHAIGVVHRDLKPDNVLLVSTLAPDAPGGARIKIVDFGIAKVEGPSVEHHTATGQTMGTLAYMAPEQVAGLPVTPAADVYALGEILYEMIAGRRVFTGSVAAVLRAKRAEAPKLELPPDVQWGPQILALVMRCLTLEPSERPPAEEMRRALSAMSSTPVAAPQVRRRPHAGVLATVAVAAGVVGFLSTRPSEPPQVIVAQTVPPAVLAPEPPAAVQPTTARSTPHACIGTWRRRTPRDLPYVEEVTITARAPTCGEWRTNVGTTGWCRGRVEGCTFSPRSVRAQRACVPENGGERYVESSTFEISCGETTATQTGVSARFATLVRQ